MLEPKGELDDDRQARQDLKLAAAALECAEGWAFEIAVTSNLKTPTVVLQSKELYVWVEGMMKNAAAERWGAGTACEKLAREILFSA